MILKKIKLQNYKGICNEKEMCINDLNLIVGKNDAGKSTILKALDCFLNTNNPLKEDLNIKANDNLITIALIFNPCEQEVIIDEKIKTTLEEEELTNVNSELEVVKVWDTSKSKITAETFIKRKKYKVDDFISSNEKQLIDLCKKLSIDTKKSNSEIYNNKEKREKIRQYHITNKSDSDYILEKLPTSGSNRFKVIHDVLKQILPRFEYFRADTSLSETDTAIQKFFKNIAIKTLEENVDTSDIETQIHEQLGVVLEEITSKINEVVSNDESVEAVVEFDWTKLISTKFKSKGDNIEVPLSSRGDGFRRITMMAYFEYLAEQQKSEQQKIIFGLEEPETFLHPSAQESLFNKLINLSENSYQVLVATHSPIIVSNCKRDKITHIFKNNGEYTIEQDISDISKIAEDLGINVDNQFINHFDKSKLLLLVEGIDDAKAINYLSKKYKENGLIQNTFEDLNVAIIPIGGCSSIKHWVTLKLLSTLNKPFVIFQDSDKESQNIKSKTRNDLLDLDFKENDDFIILKKRELENYIPYNALNRLVPNANLHYDDWSDVKKICKNNELHEKLGGRKVLRTHFNSLTFDELRSTFYNGTDDEFINLYALVKLKLKTCSS